MHKRSRKSMQIASKKISLDCQNNHYQVDSKEKNTFKPIALPDTPSKNTLPEFPTQITPVEIPQNKKFFLAQDEKSPRLECTNAVENQCRYKQKNKLRLSK